MTTRTRVDEASNRGMTYLHRLPDAVPPGSVLVHNLKARSARQRIGVQGFRVWLAPPDPARWEPCPCGYAPQLGSHCRTVRARRRAPGEASIGGDAAGA